MSEASTPDISKIVSLIMENPQLIEQISGLLKSEQRSESEKEATAVEAVAEELPKPDTETSAEASAVPTYTEIPSHKRNRSQLLCAFKPYVSSERAKAIDSMISIAEILDIMRR